MTITVRARRRTHAKGLLGVLRIERGKAFVEDDEIRVLQKRPSDEQAAALAVRQQPSRFANHLLHAVGHVLE